MNAVVDDGDLALAVELRVCALHWFGAPCVAQRVCADPDLDPSTGRLGVEQQLQPGDLSLLLARFEAPVHDGHARGVIAAVFEALEAVDEHWGGRARADVSDDSTHDLLTQEIRARPLH